ncbi:uncharacterized protein PG998_013811 [Apiospora kogelbergensis]|uniref:uncharacterized protein n=1 Tax=Apiospora kogelbergensis TaxID=1337665 RepID=UPI00312F0089
MVLLDQSSPGEICSKILYLPYGLYYRLYIDIQSIFSHIPIMLSTSNSALAKGGASNENLNKMKHHIAELEQCAKAYFREI